MTSYSLVLTVVLMLCCTCRAQVAQHFGVEFEGEKYNLINVTSFDQPLTACKDLPMSSVYPNYGNFLSANLRISLCEKAYEAEGQQFEPKFYPKV